MNLTTMGISIGARPKMTVEATLRAIEGTRLVLIDLPDLLRLIVRELS